MDIQNIESIEQVKEALKKHGVCIGKVNPKKYHAWKSELKNTISKSSLHDYMKDPYVYRWNRISGAKEQTAAMKKGSLLDCLILTPELIEEQYVIEEVNRRTKAGQERVKQIEADGKELVTPAEYDEAIRASIIASNAAKEIAASSMHTQVAIWMKVEAVDSRPIPEPIILTCMLDMLVKDDDGLRIIDLKTTSADITSTREIELNIMRYGYLMQAAMYTDMLEAATRDTVKSFSLLYLSTSQPYLTRHILLDEKAIEWAREKYLHKLEEFSHSCKHDDWGSSTLPEMTFYLPTWADNN